MRAEPREFIRFKEGRNVHINVEDGGRTMIIDVDDLEEEIYAAIGAETNIRASADQALQAAWYAESEAREAADIELRAGLTAEVETRENADDAFQAALSDETAAREDADTAFQAALSDEIADRENADTAEAEARTSADTALRDDLTVETNARIDADAALQAALNAEESAREDADAAFDAALTAETAARTGADTSLRTDLTAETNARTNTDTSLRTDLTATQTALAAETETRDDADTALQAVWYAEATARENADTALRTDLTAETTARSNAVSAEAKARTDADTDEATARANADAALQAAFEAEEYARESDDTALGAELSNEAGARANADTSLRTDLTAETNARTNADTALRTDLTDETAAREDADTALRGNINAALAEAKSYANELTANGVRYRGEVANQAGLPTTNLTVGDEYMVNDDGTGNSVFAIWDGAEWDVTSTNLSMYRQAADQDVIDAGFVTKNGTDRLMTAAEGTKLGGIAAGAEVNVQANWTQATTTADDYIKNKPGNATTSAAGLMSATDKSKLDGVATGAEVNVQSDWNQATTTADDFIKNKPGNATASAQGLMSAADKIKLDGVAAGAEVNVQSDWNQGTTTADDFIKNKPGAATPSLAGLMSAADKTKLDTIAAGVGDGIVNSVAGKRGDVTLSKSDVGLGNADNTADSAKVVASAAKLTTPRTIQTNLASAAAATFDGSANVTPGVSGTLPVANGGTGATTKPGIIQLLYNDGEATSPAGYFFTFDASGAHCHYITTANLKAAMAPGAATASVAGLMSAADKTKLDGVAAGANKYTHPSATAYAAGLYKVTVNELGHITSAVPVTKADITALGIPGTDTDTTYAPATVTLAGLMSAADKTKLDTIEPGAGAVPPPATPLLPGLMSAADKVKLDKVPESITLTGAVTGSASFDGSNNLQITSLSRGGTVGQRGSSAPGHWFKVASAPLLGGNDKNITLLFQKPYNDGNRYTKRSAGILFLGIRGDNQINIHWLVATDEINPANFVAVAVRNEMPWYVDLYLLEPIEYGSWSYSVLLESARSMIETNLWTLYTGLGVGAATLPEGEGITHYQSTLNTLKNPVVPAALPLVTITELGAMSAADKIKLDGVAAGAQVNPGAATASANGLMSAADKTKLDGIDAGAKDVTFKVGSVTF